MKYYNHTIIDVNGKNKILRRKINKIKKYDYVYICDIESNIIEGYIDCNTHRIFLAKNQKNNYSEELKKNLCSLDYSNKFLTLSIREMREVLQMSVSDFSEYLHIPQGSIRNWENNIRSCNDYLLYLIDRAVDRKFPKIEIHK